MMIIDADGAILGRLATRIAKDLLRGETITVVNTEKSIITGDPDATARRFFEKRERGDPNKGPFYPRYPDKLFKRVVRGMLPYKKDRGMKAFRRLKVVVGNPDNLKGEKIGKSIDDIKCKYVSVKDLCKRMGAKVD
jgi:large subunit ribosomal protein L13